MVRILRTATAVVVMVMYDWQTRDWYVENHLFTVKV